MRKLWTIVLLAVLTACSAGGGEVLPPSAASAQAAPGAPVDVATSLSVPWGIAFLPGGDALVTERDTGRLLRVSPSGDVRELAKIDGVRPDGEGGLMGVAVRDEHVFLYYTADRDNRIVRYRLAGDALSEPTVIVQGIPKGGIHNGGRLAFGPDGYLYATTGEVGDGSLAQDRDSLGGKILRMTTDGAPAPGNPFDTLVFSYGHRNVQGLAWDPSGRLYASEFGQNRYDEINAIRPGANYGWPVIEGRGDDRRFVNPILTWATDEASPSGMAYANGSLWVGALRGERLWQVPLTADGAPGRPVAHLTGRYGRLRAVAVAPDGKLWVGTSNMDGRGTPHSGDDRLFALTPST
ncbi:Glucose/arabinose dehydrogenase, beta-propeller fold [Nonomuraea maritima]|uniref:Glucose/arabinose dehydrogenase, beta-propeller fold n=1 Tax=Nonomuraea maritima TaxID=683260 RepID=A0A1G8VHG7_9ACTN|nr:PQQ-dependent sugar dehydrogenase [Nonomuraea maritima]SDJ65453.1 Glucose/arabinose dehydrogenase, beta-propeller fold [Nonomuraea maritima]